MVNRSGVEWKECSGKSKTLSRWWKFKFKFKFKFEVNFLSLLTDQLLKLAGGSAIDLHSHDGDRCDRPTWTWTPNIHPQHSLVELACFRSSKACIASPCKNCSAEYCGSSRVLNGLIDLGLFYLHKLRLFVSPIFFWPWSFESQLIFGFKQWLLNMDCTDAWQTACFGSSKACIL